MEPDPNYITFGTSSLSIPQTTEAQICSIDRGRELQWLAWTSDSHFPRYGLAIGDTMDGRICTKQWPKLTNKAVWLLWHFTDASWWCCCSHPEVKNPNRPCAHQLFAEADKNRNKVGLQLVAYAEVQHIFIMLTGTRQLSDFSAHTKKTWIH